MPHFVFEYAREIEQRADLNAVMEGLYEAGCECGFMQPEDIKVRAIAVDHFRLRKAGETFVHVTISMLEGRTDQQKEKLSIIAREKLSKLLPWVTSLSFDVRDMNDVAYKKRLLPE